ncbi:MAG: hypothetical protein HGA87_02145 [Desulfobulbaceae bacterium]|nr:hypothetical protein [Desulfobulbaceae bacterium]
MDLAELISTGAVIVAIAALAYQIYQSNIQARLQNFTNYTQRYQDIFLNLPIDIESNSYNLDKLDKDKKEETLRWIRAYFDLCSEEFYLNQNRYLDKNVWILWEAGMRDCMKKAAFKQAWQIIQGEGYYSEEFGNFISHIKNHVKL